MSKVSTALHFVKRTQTTVTRETSPDAHWVPNTDVYLGEQGLVIKVELAGMQPEDLEVTIEGHRLRISGHRPDGCRAGKCNFIVMEINYGSFENVIELPPGYDLKHAKAAYQNGFLRIDVPESSPTEPRNVAVTTHRESKNT